MTARIAVLIPCYNEEAAVAKVVEDFRRALPGATIYVYDNASTDGTAAIAAAAGAVVRHEPRKGKGHVIRRMFADVDADFYVMVDGDDTYDADIAPSLVEALRKQHLDMVIGARAEQEETAYRPGHKFGNRLLTGLVGLLFGRTFTDMLSGYRVFSRRFVRSFPALSGGFETETEITIHALQMGMAVLEIPAGFRDRPTGSASKLHTFRDGIRIMAMIALLLKEVRPLFFFGCIASVLALLSVLFSIPVFITYSQTGEVPRFPTAILSTGLMILAFLSGVCGLVLDSVSRGRLETKRLAWLALPPPQD